MIDLPNYPNHSRCRHGKQCSGYKRAVRSFNEALRQCAESNIKRGWNNRRLKALVLKALDTTDSDVIDAITEDGVFEYGYGDEPEYNVNHDYAIDMALDIIEHWQQVIPIK